MMAELRKIFLLVVLFNLFEHSLQSRNELSKLLIDSIIKKQQRNRWLAQKIEPLKPKFDLAFTNDQIAYEDAKMLVYLIHEIRGLQDKLTSPPIYWYSKMG